jgi:MoxR-like ATPase
MATMTTGRRTSVQPVAMDWLPKLQALVREMPISGEIVRRIVRLVRATRPQTTTLDEVKRSLRWGAGPRAIQNLILAARADALVRGQSCVNEENVTRFVVAVLKHRVIAEPSGEFAISAILELVQKRFLS